jgi:hypothetical protein
VQEIFEKNESKILIGAIVWTPMLVTDNLDAANKHEGIFSDFRVKQFWDQDRIFGPLMSQTLNLKESIAWDVYLLYSPDHPWNTEHPPAPVFWMHRLNEEPNLFLDSARFEQYVQLLLERISIQ